ncbi:MAG: hypothetical protein ACAI44_20655 [Candidatus Sericytochromatia bacterium]
MNGQPFGSSLLTGQALLPHDATALETGKELESLRQRALGYDLKAYARRLESLDDGLPAPQVFSWSDSGADHENLERSLGLTADEVRVRRVFSQIMEQKRKSGKHYQAFAELCARYPDSERLSLELNDYLLRWQPEAGKRQLQELAARHPDWLLLRTQLATVLVLQGPPEELPAGTLEAASVLLDGRLELHQHLQLDEHDRPEAGLVWSFYYATAGIFIAQGRFERALYSLNVCARIHPPERLDPLLVLLFMRQDDQASDRLRRFLSPLPKTAEGADDAPF